MHVEMVVKGDKRTMDWRNEEVISVRGVEATTCIKAVAMSCP